MSLCDSSYRFNFHAVKLKAPKQLDFFRALKYIYDSFAPRQQSEMYKGISKADMLCVVPINAGVGRRVGTEFQPLIQAKESASASCVRDDHSLSVDILSFFVQAQVDLMSKISIQFGLAVRKLRKQLRLTQEELASRCGLHRTYLTDIERGARNPSLKIIERIAGGLDVSIAGLMRAMDHEKAKGVRL